MEKYPDDVLSILFPATAFNTQPSQIDGMDLYDNLTSDLDRVKAIAEYLECVNEDLVEAQTLGATGLILHDLHRRMRYILEVWLENTKKKPTKKASKKQSCKRS